MSTTQIVSVAVLGVLLLWAVGAIGRLAQLRRAIGSAWTTTEAQIRRRAELVEHLLGRMAAALPPPGHPEEACQRQQLERVAAAKGQCGAIAALVAVHPEDAGPVRSLVIAESVLDGLLAPLVARVREEPGTDDAKALCDELANSANQLLFAGQQFNESVLAYNAAARQFPTSMLAAVARFQPAGLLDLPEHAAQRESQRV